MLTLYDQQEVLEDLIASEKREMKEDIARACYENGISVEIIAKSLDFPVKKVKRLLNIEE